MSDKNLHLLNEAIDRNVGAVLSLPSAGLLYHCKTRFLGQFDGNILLEAPAGHAALIAELVSRGAHSGVCFRNGVHKVIFTSPIVRVETQFRISAEVKIDVLLVAFPTEAKAIQRRNNYRASVSDASGISLKVWRIPPKASLHERPMPSQEIKTELVDLGVGGVGVKLIGKDDGPPVIDEADRLRLELKAENQSWLLEGKMRPRTGEPRGNTIVTGIQFKKLEQDMEGRRTLAQITRIVGELQRQEVRRSRNGPARAS
jgi:c-di-GMP-binding flagellar brake protein YcgR